MLNPFFVIYARTRGLDRLPGEDIPYSIVPPALQSGEVDMGILQGEGPGMKIYTVSIEEVLRNMRRLVRIAGVLGVPC
jgi:hypothetical protein